MSYLPLSGYTIDGYDTYGTWKIRVKRITGLYQFLARKGDISQSWPDSDGEEAFTDANDISFEGRDIIMFCYLMTSSFDLAVPNNAFGGFLKSFKRRLELPGLRTLVVPYSSTSFSLMYVKGSDVDMRTPQNVMIDNDYLTQVKETYFIGDFWIQFREPTPTRG